MPEAVRGTVYRHQEASVDVKLRPSGWFGQIRVWRGKRWPKLERTWYARMRSWIPWFSLERQASKAVAYVNHTTPRGGHVPPELQGALDYLLDELRWKEKERKVRSKK